MISAGVIGWLAAALQIAGYAWYIRNFLNKSIRPNAASFLMFAYGTSFILLLEWHSGASVAMLALPGACAAMGIVIAFMCLRNGATEPLDGVEKGTFAVDVALTLAYASALTLFGQSPLYALPFLLLSNATGLTSFFPLLRSTYLSPDRERAAPWMIWTVAYGLLTGATVLDGGVASPALLIYPIMNLVLHAAMAILSLRTTGPSKRFRDGDMIVENRQSAIHGLGMFAGRAYQSGQEIWVLKGRPVIGSTPNAHPNAVGFAADMWIDPEPPFEFVNHSCAPNAAFGRNGEFYALKAIGRGEEITMDYSATEADPEWRMPCSCGAAACRKELRSIQIAFAGSMFPPPAAPALQAIWREHRQAATRPAFPQLGGGQLPGAAEQVVPIREVNET